MNTLIDKKSAYIRAFFLRKIYHYRFNKLNNSATRQSILAYITKLMISIIILQSAKLLIIFYTQASFYNIQLHVLNLVLHLVIFTFVLRLLSKQQFTLARKVLLLSFSTYLCFACILWEVNLNLQYYFLLAMFISHYLFSHAEKHIAFVWSLVFLSLFLVASFYLPSINSAASYSFHSLTNMRYVNASSFALACGLCAWLIQHLIDQNWKKIKTLENKHETLLKKLFPVSLAQTLIDKTNGELQQTKPLAVLFLDICNFTQFALMHDNKEQNSWRFIYQLFRNFDTVLKHLDVTRIKINGDQYILLIGLNNPSSTNKEIVNQGIQSIDLLLSTSTLPIKIGLAYGSVTYGVFEPSHPQFDIWGEAVIRASRLEAIAKENSALIDEPSAHLFSGEQQLIPQKKQLKGIGYQNVYQYLPPTRPMS